VISFSINDYQSNFKLITDDFNLSHYKKYSRYAMGYEMRKPIFSLYSELSKLSKSKTILPRFIVSIYPTSWLKIFFEESIQEFYQTLNFKYSDFLYEVDDFLLSKNKHLFGFEAKGSHLFLRFLADKRNLKNSLVDLDLSHVMINDAIEDRYSILARYNFNSSQILEIKYNTLNISRAFDLRKNSSLSVFNVNNFSEDSYQVDVNYNQIFLGKKIRLGVMHQEVDFLLSNRFRPSTISSDLEDIFDVSLLSLIINNNNDGNLIQEMISIRVENNNLSMINPSIQIDWLKDRYKAKFNIYGYQFGFPAYVNKSTLNLTGKESIVLKLGLDLLIDTWKLNMLFSQHIPYKFYYTTNDTEDSPMDNTEYYFGGLFRVELIKILD